MNGYTGCEFKIGDKVVPRSQESGYLHQSLVKDSTYVITNINNNGRVDVEGTFKHGVNGNGWDSGWFKLYEEKEVKVENTCKFKPGDVVVCTEKDSDALEGNFLSHGQSYLVIEIGAYDKFEGCFLLEVQNIETRQPASAYEYRFSLKQETSNTAESLRNSILSLQQERVSLQEKIEQNIAQKKALTAQLKELGFLLVESKGQPTNAVDETKTVLYAEDIEEDMTDPRNWKVGDLILCVDADGWRGWIDEGEIAEMVEEFTTLLTLKTKYGVHRFSSSYCEDFKFHSRPITN